jgi:hypothetical protein
MIVYNIPPVRKSLLFSQIFSDLYESPNILRPIRIGVANLSHVRSKLSLMRAAGSDTTSSFSFSVISSLNMLWFA